MLTMAQIESRKAQLAQLLPALKAGEIECIEYGKPGDRMMAYLRLRYMSTAGGDQFQIRRLSYGVEGSGDYTPDEGEAMNKALDAAMYFHRPLEGRLAKALQEIRARNGRGEETADVYCFHAVTNASTVTVNLRAKGLEDWGPARDAVVFDLGQRG